MQDSYYQDENAGTACKSCPIGWDPRKPFSLCAQCGIGKFGTEKFNNATSTSCLPCSAGKYRGDTNSTACHSCASGKFQPEEGKTLCFSCAPGKSQSEQGKTECDPCEINSYAASGASACTNCLVGLSTQNKIGASECTSCPIGKFGENCLPCSAGTFRSSSSVASAASCTTQLHV